MAQTREGAIKVAAKRVGVSVHEYERRLADGLKWCTGCRRWHDRSEFGRDTTRWDGLVPSCRSYKNRRNSERYVPRLRPRPGRRFVAARDGDMKQAERRVNHLKDIGLIPNANDLPCTDCGHVCTDGDPLPHEYDHYLGYAAEHHETVEPVCRTCHHQRSWSRLRREKNGEAKYGR